MIAFIYPISSNDEMFLVKIVAKQQDEANCFYRFLKKLQEKGVKFQENDKNLIQFDFR
jgi:hypothetical protein